MAEKYFRQGLKISVSGRIQTGSYTNRDGQKVYTTEVVVEEQEFAESKSNSLNNSQHPQQQSQQPQQQAPRQQQNSGKQQNCYADDGFMNIPDGIDEELPFA